MIERLGDLTRPLGPRGILLLERFLSGGDETPRTGALVGAACVLDVP